MGGALFGLDFNKDPVYPGALVFGACCWGNLSNGLELVAEGFLFCLVLTGSVNDVGRLGEVSIPGFLLLETTKL